MEVEESINVLDDSVNAHGYIIEADQNSERSVHPEVGVIFDFLNMCSA